MSLTALPAAAKPVSLFAKVGVDGAATDAAIQDCNEAAKSARARVNMPVATSLNPYALVGTAIAGGIIAGYEQAKAHRLAVEACMRGKGFANLELTPAEDAEVRALKAEARPAWRDAFLKTDLKARVETALAPAVPPMTPAADEPLVEGGVRFDPAKLTAAAGPVGLKAPLLTGEINHRRTATLAEPLTLPIVLNPHAEAGAVFHQITAGETTLWCGTLASKPLLTAEKHDTYCLASDFDGYHVGFGGPAWLGENSPWPQPMVAKGGRLALKESDTDLIGPMRLVIQATGWTKNGGVFLEAQAFRDGDKAVFWHGAVPLDDAGHGALPFWSHRLQLQKTGKMLTASFTPDGDGRGWDEIAGRKPKVPPQIQPLTKTQTAADLPTTPTGG